MKNHNLAFNVDKLRNCGAKLAIDISTDLWTGGCVHHQTDWNKQHGWCHAYPKEVCARCTAPCLGDTKEGIQKEKITRCDIIRIGK